MRVAGLRSWTSVAIGCVIVSLLAGCSGGATNQGPAVPTFAPSDSPVGSAAASAPLDPCVALISPEDVAGVLGLEVGKVDVRTVRGVPAPSVGRTERTDCSYVGDKGQDLFDIRAAAYDTTVSAGQQWMLNLVREDGDRRDVTVGPASGLVFTRRGEQLLTVLTGNRTLAIELPDNTAPRGRAPANLIVDFAQRALKVDPSTTPAAAPSPAAQPPATAAPLTAAPTGNG